MLLSPWNGCDVLLLMWCAYYVMAVLREVSTMLVEKSSSCGKSERLRFTLTTKGKGGW